MEKSTWPYYSPVGHITLSATVKKLTTLIRETGYFTNHSLRRTCATRLFQKGVDEQRIMVITGHRSKDGVRTYKKISRTQEEVTDILQNSKKTKVEDVALGPTLSYNITGCNVTINH